MIKRVFHALRTVKATSGPGQFVVLFAMRLGAALGMFAINVALARGHNLSVLADFALMIAATSLCSLFLSLGFGTGAHVRVAMYNARKDWGRIKGYVLTGFGAIFCISGALIFACATFIFVLPIVSLREHLEVGIYVVVGAAGLSALGLVTTTLNGSGHTAAAALSDGPIKVAILILALCALWALSLPFSFAAMALAVAAAGGLSTIAAIAVSAEFWRKVMAAEALFEIRDWIGSALPWLGTSLSWDYAIDALIIVVSIAASAEELALLHICFRYRVLAGFGTRTIHTLALPRLAQAVEQANMRDLNQRLFRLNLSSLVFAAAAMMGCVVLSPWLFAPFGIDPHIGLPVLLAAMCVLVVRAVFGPGPALLGLQGRHFDAMLSGLLGLTTAVSVALPLFAVGGTLGAAAAYGLGMIVASCLAAWQTSRLGGARSTLIGAWTKAPLRA